MVMAPPYMHDSAVSPYFHGCPALLHRHFPPQSSLYPLDSSLCSQHLPSPWDCSTIPKLSSQLLHLPGDLCPCLGMHGWGEDCLILTTFRLPPVSSFTLRLKCFSSDSDNCPDVGMGPLLQFPHPPRAGPVLVTLLFPLTPPSSFILLSVAWFYIFFSGGQVLLSALSWYSACTSVSEGVFLLYLWREM